MSPSGSRDRPTSRHRPHWLRPRAGRSWHRPPPGHVSREDSMGLFSSMTLNSLNDLFVVQIKDVYDAEQRLTKALPKMAEAATNKQLKSPFQDHLRHPKPHAT